MSKCLWIPSVALMLLLAPAATADEPGEGPKLHGPGEAAWAWGAEGELEVPWSSHSVEALKLGEYWVGLECYPARGALRAQLGLPGDYGLVVGKVVPGGPAAEAGIQQHDVLLKAGEKPLEKVADLVEAIHQAKDKGLSIALIRGGKPERITVTPAKRPRAVRPKDLVKPPGDEALDAYKKLLETLKRSDADEATKRALEYLERLRPSEGWKGPMRWRFFGPGAILPPGTRPGAPLPGNMSVTITKQGDKPAEITVKQGDQKWEVTEKELDRLPKEVRPHVERMLGHRAWVGAAEPGPPDQGETRYRHFDFIPDWSAPGQLEDRVEKRLEEINRRIDRLRKSIEQLREKLPRLKGEPEQDPDKV